MEALLQSEAATKDELAVRARTREREHFTLQELIQTKLDAQAALTLERTASLRREIDIREKHRVELKADSETHRLELKSDGEKTLTTATIAAEKAVQAALAAAEKARDQQTIASQLATTKAEDASKEQLKQQGETFTTQIAALSTGLGDVKSLLGELRAERRGGQDQVVVQRDNAAEMKPLLDAIAALTVAQANNQGRDVQIKDAGISSRAWAAISLTAIFGVASLMIAAAAAFAR